MALHAIAGLAACGNLRQKYGAWQPVSASLLRGCLHLPLALGPPWRYTVGVERISRSRWRGRMEILTVPQLAIPTASKAMALVNQWLHRGAGMGVHTPL